MKKLLITSISFLGLATLLNASVIISDDFNTADTSDLDTDLATRQSGSAATKGWLTNRPDETSIASNTLFVGDLTDNNVTMNYDFATDPNLLVNGEFKISFQMDPNSSAYSAFTIGSPLSALSARPIIASGTDVGFLMESGGRLNMFSGGSSISDQSNAISFTGGMDQLEFTVTTADFDAATPYTVGMTVNGAVIDLDPNTASNLFTGVWDAEGVNYMYISSRGPVGLGNTLVDNYTVASVPEPAHYAIGMGVLALGCMVLRRRNARA